MFPHRFRLIEQFEHVQQRITCILRSTLDLRLDYGETARLSGELLTVVGKSHNCTLTVTMSHHLICHLTLFLSSTMQAGTRTRTHKLMFSYHCIYVAQYVVMCITVKPP